jgi:hypothetical protein
MSALTPAEWSTYGIQGFVATCSRPSPIIELPKCPCGTTEQTIDHLIFQCELLGKERDKLILGVAKTDNWPIGKNGLIREHFKLFSKFSHEISLEKLNEM